MKNPNIVFILADDMGYWALNSYGNEDVITPSLNRLAKTGVQYSNFFCASPVCSPARASILSGTIPSFHGVLDWLSGGNLPQGIPEMKDMWGYKNETKPISYLESLTCYTDLLAEEDYNIGLSGKWHLGNSLVPQHGFSSWFTLGRGGCAYNNPDVVENGKINLPQKYITDIIADNAIETMDKFTSEDKPFYMSIHFTAPHSPWDKEDHPSKIWDLYENCKFEATPDLPLYKDQVDTCPHGTGEKRKELLRGYYTAITAMDKQIGRILDYLEEKKLIDNTIIMFTSDNGMNLGQHGIWGKGNGTYPQNMYDTSVKVPFIVSWKNHVKENTICENLYSHYDIMPTFIDILSLAGNVKQELIGKSFSKSFTEPCFEEDGVIAIFDEYGPVRMLRTKEWKLIISSIPGGFALFNMLKDKDEEENLFYNPEYKEVVLMLYDKLEQIYNKYSNKEIAKSVNFVTGSGQKKAVNEFTPFVSSAFGDIPNKVKCSNLEKNK